MRALALLLALSTSPAAMLLAQRPDSLAEEVRKYVSVDTGAVALTHVLLIDGTGSAPKTDQTVLVQNGRIAQVGPAAECPCAGRGRHDGSQRTHPDSWADRAARPSLLHSGRGPGGPDVVYRSAAVPGLRRHHDPHSGGRSPYAEINLRENINKGLVPGPRIHLTAPYITGAAGGGSMDVVTTPEEARRFVAYWASEGATWIKAYTDIRRSELGAAIKEAHRRGVKVTGHLCSVSFREAVELGIDNLEHGMLTASDFDPSKQPDVCPVSVIGRNNSADVQSETAKSVIQTMVRHKVSMTSTLAVYEPFVANRPTKDARVLNAMSPEVRASYMKMRNEIDSSGSGPIAAEGLQSAMAFEKEFVEAGGLLAAGVDPTGLGGALAGYGDQRNYELLIEAGFTPQQTIQIMTLNGARILGVQQRLGSVEKGKLADLVVLKGDLTSQPSAIRNPTVVFKDGVGYDPAKLIASIEGRVGID